MAYLNEVKLIGNLTRDPELKRTSKGTAVVEIGIAVNRSYKDENTGERKDDTTFLDVTFWGKQAEIIGQYMKKGKPIFVDARLQVDTWEDKETGAKRQKLKVVGNSFQFLGSKSESNQSSNQQGNQPSAPASDDWGNRIPANDGDDIPF